MKLKRVAALTLAAGMACTSLAACGSKNTPTAAPETAAKEEATTAADAESKEETTAASGEKQVLSVTTWDYDTTPQFSAVVKAYEAKNPNVEIKVIDTSADEYNNSLGISLSAAQADPDVIWVKDMGSMLQMADDQSRQPGLIRIQWCSRAVNVQRYNLRTSIPFRLVRIIL